MPAPSCPPLRTALVGLGRIGFGFHGPAILAHRGFHLVGVVDPLPERREEVSRAWNAPAHPTLEALLASTPVDLVVIASPTNFHAEHARLSFAHGAHVFCDKPVARSVAELDAMLAAARAAKRRFLAYQPARFASELLALRDLLHRGVLGPLHYIRRSRCAYVRRNDWQSRRTEGGGMLNNWGPHCLDEIIAVLPAERISRVLCATRVIASTGDAEDFVKATLTTESGIIIDVDVSQACALSAAPWEIRGQYGSAVYDQTLRVWQARFFDPAAAGPAPAQQPGLAADARTYSNEQLPWQTLTLQTSAYGEFDYYDAAWSYFTSGANAPVSPEQSKHVIELIERCRESAG